jgi:hypothetical protein
VGFGNDARESLARGVSASSNVEPATTQPNYFAPTYGDVVNLTGLL